MDGETPEKRKRRIAILTPVQRAVEADFTASLLKTVAAVPGVIGWFHALGHANIARARNLLVAEALGAGFDDIVFIDADIGWEPSAFTKLFDVPDDVAVVAGAPQRRAPEELSFCGSLDQSARVHGRLVTGHAATAFLRVRADALRQLAHKVEAYDYRGTTCRAWFNYRIGPNVSGESVGYIGEDYDFSMLCREHGLDVWIDPTIELRHWHAAPLSERMADHIVIGAPEQKEGVS